MSTTGFRNSELSGWGDWWTALPAHDIAYTQVTRWQEVEMAVTVGVREFRQDLADYIDGNETVTVTRHGRRVGVFIPTHGDRAEAIAVFQAATAKLQALMAEHGIDENEVVAEFDAARKAGHKAQRDTGSARRGENASF